MKCEHCGKPATVHLTKIVNKEVVTLHLCEACEKQQELIPEGPGPALNLPALLALLMGQAPQSLTCPVCGLKYAMFKNEGRLGCPADYDAFRTALEPLLVRIHRGTSHVGKTPRAAAGRLELSQLREQLTAAVANENYEEAARIRDRIRQKEGPG